MKLVAVCAASVLLAVGSAAAQPAGPGAAGANAAPPRDVPVVEVPREKLSSLDISKYGKQALEMDPSKWKHAETANYILHFRRLTEARKVARELEFNIWFVTQTLGRKPDPSMPKGHAFIFEDEGQWIRFRSTADFPQWSSSVAHGDELFLNVRGEGGERFDSQTLAHEATHAVIARLYPGQEWPLYLNEGFAEYMGAAGVAARKNQTVGRHLGELPQATLTPQKLEELKEYPRNTEELSTFYQSGEKLVRFMMTVLPRERFPKFVDEVVSGKKLVEAMVTVYPEQIPNEEAFPKLYEKFRP